LKVTIVASVDQTMAWVFIEDGPPPLNQLKQLLYGYLFTAKQKGGHFGKHSTGRYVHINVNIHDNIHL
jgi:hypothetical protein